MPDRTISALDEAESLKLISPGGIGRIAYQSRFGPAVLPVNYKWHDGAIVFSTAQPRALDEDTQTGTAGTARWTRTWRPGSPAATTWWRSRSTRSTRSGARAGAS